MRVDVEKSMKNGKEKIIGAKKIFYLFIFMVAFFIILGAFLLPTEKKKTEDYQEFVAEWNQVFKDGTKKLITVPGSCVVERGETAVAEAVLPDYIQDGKWLCFRGSQQNMRIYIDGELREEYNTENSRFYGKTSQSAYVFVPLYQNDIGKILRVETESVSSFSGTMNKIYYGDKFAIWESFAEQYGMELIIAIIMLILAIVCIVFSIVLKFCHNKEITLEYLGWGILLIAVWIITENRLRQLIFPNISVVASVTFFSLMLALLPFAIYMNSIQKFRYQKCYQIICTLLIIEFCTFTGLQLFNILDFFETMLGMHIIIVVCATVMAITIIIDIKKKYIESYRSIAIGLVALMIAALVEITKVYLNHGQVSGIGLCLGLIFLLIMAAIKTGKEVFYIERERERALVDNQTKSSFLAKMSHELRTPINTIIGMNEMIARENKDASIEPYVNSAYEAGKTLLALVNDVLDFSKIESGRLNLTENVYQLASLINDQVHMIQARAEKKNLEVQVNIDEKLPSYLYGDEVRIKQIISNLLSNAEKYTEEGTITFTVGYTSNDDGQFFLKISITDTGIGIEEKEMEHLFDCFYKINAKKNRAAGGTGLGLHIIKQLLDEMQGEIKVRSIYGKGSMFTVTIPQKVIDAEPIGMVTSEFALEKMNLAKCHTSFIAPEAKVLAVDDNEMNLAVVKGLLKRTGIQLDTAVSGQQCLELCKNKYYHVILMDHMMPEPDGIQTLQLLRQQTEGCNINTPVVVLTANAVAGSREEYLSDGFAEYLSKPIVSDKLEKILMKFIPQELIELQELQEVELEKEADSINKVPNLEGEEKINPELGLAYSGGDEEVYKEMLSAYYQQGKIYAEKLPQYFEQKDWKNYAIISHALKSTSLSVGARGFSDMAKEHEMAGKEEKVEWLEAAWENFYQELLKVLAAVEEMLAEELTEEKEILEEEITTEDYLKECEILLDYLQNYEMNASLEQVNKLETKTTRNIKAEKKTELLKEIRNAIDEFDYGKAEELLKEWMKEV